MNFLSPNYISIKSFILKNKHDLILFLFAISFKAVSTWLSFLCILILLIRDIQRRRFLIKFDFTMLLLLCIFILFFFNAIRSGTVTIHNMLWYSVPSVFSFIIGRDIIKKSGNSMEILYWLFIFALFLALPHVPITLLDIFRTGLVNPERSISVIGSEDVQRAVTGRTVELSLAISGIAMLFVKDLQLKSLSKYFIALSIIAELCTLHFVSRTGVALLVIALVIGLLYKWKLSYKTFLFLCFAFALFYVLQNTSLFNVFAEREIEGSSISDAGGRTERWVMGFAMILANPNGYMIEDWYAHNFWIDFGLDGGLVSFVMLILFSIVILIKSLMIQKIKLLPDSVRYILLLFSIIFVLTLFTEPVHTGATVYMYVYFMFSGMIVEIVRQFKTK